jgi:hypothetical protein
MFVSDKKSSKHRPPATNCKGARSADLFPWGGGFSAHGDDAVISTRDRVASDIVQFVRVDASPHGMAVGSKTALLD